jgi:pterin-4a-carbinolamine dehydratase
LGITVLLDQALQGFCIQQRNIAVDHEDIARKTGWKRSDSQLHRTAGARDLILVHNDALGQIDFDNFNQAIAFMTNNRNDVCGI